MTIYQLGSDRSICLQVTEIKLTVDFNNTETKLSEDNLIRLRNLSKKIYRAKNRSNKK